MQPGTHSFLNVCAPPLTFVSNHRPFKGFHPLNCQRGWLKGGSPEGLNIFFHRACENKVALHRSFQTLNITTLTFIPFCLPGKF